jgi:nicotinamidase-related amidase
VFRPDHADVVPNAPIFRSVAALGAMADGSWGAAFHDGLGPLPGEFVVTHNRIGAFHGSGLGDVLRALDVRHLILAGVATTSVVLTTAGQAADIGYHLTIARDACAAAQAELHEAALSLMALIAEVAPVERILPRLSGGTFQA